MKRVKIKLSPQLLTNINYQSEPDIKKSLKTLTYLNSV